MFWEDNKNIRAFFRRQQEQQGQIFLRAKTTFLTTKSLKRLSKVLVRASIYTTFIKVSKKLFVVHVVPSLRQPIVFVVLVVFKKPVLKKLVFKKKSLHFRIQEFLFCKPKPKSGTWIKDKSKVLPLFSE